MQICAHKIQSKIFVACCGIKGKLTSDKMYKKEVTGRKGRERTEGRGENISPFQIVRNESAT